MSAPPLIVSALLDANAQDDLDAQRRRYFPVRRQQVGAHLTLFHALPGEREDEVGDSLREVADRPPIDAEVGRPFLLGRGVAYPVHASELEDVQAEVARLWWDQLTRQDRQRWSPHVTVQNKVDPQVARRTLADLEVAHAPYRTRVRGLALWRYRGGPWEAVREYPFADGPS